MVHDLTILWYHIGYAVVIGSYTFFFVEINLRARHHYSSIQSAINSYQAYFTRNRVGKVLLHLMFDIVLHLLLYEIRVILTTSTFMFEENLVHSKEAISKLCV